ncbi:hypothetical protein OK18_04685 [Chryseobacterium gallinarum]|uniref:NIPSNAP domain-containing protein n=1 Tax=Chryseobacterium gallinarum TaxID=1324352 RepID=A0A0G3M0A0_CHRGL|nr:hypothetical protein [Chryseobacterium gallinarum]AKK72025.1 hypothetical protein OK18_04685 [Chryseobacterium gallinarum]
MKLYIFVFIFFIFNIANGQSDTMGQFAIWKPKDGQLKKFEDGYKQHLGWHKNNKDPWSWYGWFIISGQRYGQFVDATFNLQWADFDKAVKPSEDMADNRINVFPYADVQTIFKVTHLSEFSTGKSFSDKLKLSRLLTLQVDDIDKTYDLLKKLQTFYESKKIKSAHTFKIADGGNLNELIIILGFANWEDYAISEDILHEIRNIDSKLNNKIIKSIQSETLVLREDLSYFP